MSKVLIFIDFWNLQLSWKANVKDQNIGIHWGETLTNALMNAINDKNAKYQGTNIYASVDSSPNSNSKGFRNFLGAISTQPGYKVILKDRKAAKDIHCSKCHSNILDCPKCNEPFKRYNEKGVDTTLVTDLLRYSFDNVFDTAILVSGDADFIPAIEYIQDKGKHVIHAGWKNSSYDLKKTCWYHFDLDSLVKDIAMEKKPKREKEIIEVKTTETEITIKS